MTRRLFALPATLLSLFVLAAPMAQVKAQEVEKVLPETRMILTMNKDFVGNDLTQLFDTTFDACRTACEADKSCVAFTFNSKSNACFPKSEVTAEDSYEGAQSGHIIRTNVIDQVFAVERRLDIDFVGMRSIRAARDFAYRIGWTHPAGQFALKDMLDASRDQRNSGDLLNAMRWMGGAITVSDSADQWAEYARLLIDVAPTAGNRSREYTKRSLSAAVNA